MQKVKGYIARKRAALNYMKQTMFDWQLQEDPTFRNILYIDNNYYDTENISGSYYLYTIYDSLDIDDIVDRYIQISPSLHIKQEIGETPLLSTLSSYIDLDIKNTAEELRRDTKIKITNISSEQLDIDFTETEFGPGDEVFFRFDVSFESGNLPEIILEFETVYYIAAKNHCSRVINLNKQYSTITFHDRFQINEDYDEVFNITTHPLAEIKEAHGLKTLWKQDEVNVETVSLYRINITPIYTSLVKAYGLKNLYKSETVNINEEDQYVTTAILQSVIIGMFLISYETPKSYHQ